MLGCEPPVEPTPTISTGLHQLRLLPDMRLLLDTFFGDVERARRRVDVECYIVNSDVLGRLLGIALVKAAQRGVRTRLLFDPIGSEKADPAFFDELRANGVEVRAYRNNLKGLLGRGRTLTRDHGRIMVVDDCAYTGGAAWGDQWLPAEKGGHGWHDVCHRVEGPVVQDFAELFSRRWDEATGEACPCNYDTEDRFPDVRLVSDTPDSVNVIEPLHREAIDGARRRVWIANAYFYPSQLLKETIYRAAARGLEVRLITVDETDLPIIKSAARADYEEWITNGIEVREYQPAIMHSKYLVIDDAWCSIGTWNANPTSTGLVNEVNLIIKHPGFVAEVARQFERDLANSAPVTVEMARQRTLGTRVVDAVGAKLLRAVDLVVGQTYQDERAPEGAPAEGHERENK
jgi:cardiolipin synthase